MRAVGWLACLLLAVGGGACATAEGVDSVDEIPRSGRARRNAGTCIRREVDAETGQPDFQVATTSTVPLRGTLKKAAIAGEVRRALPAFERCYVDLLEREPDAAGRLVMQFLIDRTGRVSQMAVLSNEISAGEFEDCELDVLCGLRFPAPEGGGFVLVSYPFIFSST